MMDINHPVRVRRRERLKELVRESLRHDPRFMELRARRAKAEMQRHGLTVVQGGKNDKPPARPTESEDKPPTAA